MIFFDGKWIGLCNAGPRDAIFSVLSGRRVTVLVSLLDIDYGKMGVSAICPGHLVAVIAIGHQILDTMLMAQLLTAVTAGLGIPVGVANQRLAPRALTALCAALTLTPSLRQFSCTWWPAILREYASVTRPRSSCLSASAGTWCPPPRPD